jgi:phosphatidate cytidylyltransferase
MFVPLFLTIIYLLVSELYLNNPNPLQNWAFSMMALLYIALPFSLLGLLAIELRTVEGLGMPLAVIYNWMLPLSIFIFLWTSDSGAYIFGSWLGKHRLFPRISPKKSWEGSIGGALVALVASQIIAIWSNDFSPSSDLLNRLGWAGLALVVVIFGTWGDLVESLLKRKLGIKDSGNILPGHGGMLDRFDSSLLAIPAATIYIYTVSVY